MRIIVCCPDPEDKKLAAFAASCLASPAPGASPSAAELMTDSAFARNCKKKACDAFVYFDLALGRKRVLELASQLDEVEGCAWGLIDRAGEAADPASWFFEGACDYVGPALLKAGLGPGRLNEALAYAGFAECEDDEAPEAQAAAFPGWAELAEVAVRFCYAAIGDQKGLLERIGEKRLDKLRDDFAAFLEPWSRECGGIVWIKESAGCLVLFPPQDESMNPVLAAFRLLLDRALIGYEVFKLEAPLTFRFAIHAGHTMWRKPGATGSVVAEDVNFVFHLGMKAGVDGSILVSGDASRSVPASLGDLFSPSSSFEGRSVQASRRFRN
jgi:hypothetical protein